MIVPKYSQFYKAIVATIITDNNNEATMELRIRVPAIHYGLKDTELPIAKPLSIPGVAIDKQMFIDQIQSNPHVYVMFESGDLNKPLYIVSSEATFSKAVSAIGPQGPAGVSPHIGLNGNWFIDEEDLGVKAQGPKGDTGDPGQDGPPGVSPHIGTDGNWWVGDTNTGIKAQGKDATTKFLDPVIVMTGPEKLFQPNIYIYDGVLLSTNDTVLDHTSSKVYKYNGLIYEELHEVNIGEIMSITKGKKRGGLMYIKDELGFKKIKDSELSKWITIEGDI